MPVVKTQGVAIGFELLPDGLYEATVTRRKNADDESRSFVTFTVKRVLETDGDEAFVKSAQGKQVMKTYSWKPQAIWSWKRDMVHAGVDPKQLERDDTDTDKIIDALIGREVFIEVGHHDHQGKTYNDVEIVEPEDAWSTPAAASANGRK